MSVALTRQLRWSASTLYALYGCAWAVFTMLSGCHAQTVPLHELQQRIRPERIEAQVSKLGAKYLPHQL